MTFINVTTVSSTTIRMSWRPIPEENYKQRNGALWKFRVEYKPINESEAYDIDNIAPNALSEDVSCLDPNTEYRLRVCREFFILKSMYMR